MPRRLCFADTEKAEAENPCEHGGEHHSLDSEFLEDRREWQVYRELRRIARDGDEECGVLGPPSSCESRNDSEMVDEGGTVTVGDLQGYAEQHTEYEKI